MVNPLSGKHELRSDCDSGPPVHDLRAGVPNHGQKRAYFRTRNNWLWFGHKLRPPVKIMSRWKKKSRQDFEGSNRGRMSIQVIMESYNRRSSNKDDSCSDSNIYIVVIPSGPSL